MANKIITDYTENTSPDSGDAILIDTGAGVYNYVTKANLGLNFDDLGASGTKHIEFNGSGQVNIKNGDLVVGDTATDYIETTLIGDDQYIMMGKAASTKWNIWNDNLFSGVGSDVFRIESTLGTPSLYIESANNNVTIPNGNLYLKNANSVVLAGGLSYYQRAGFSKGQLGVAQANDGIIVGSSSDDFCIRASNSNVLFSANDGVNIHMQIANNGNVSVSDGSFFANDTTTGIHGVEVTNNNTSTGSCRLYLNNNSSSTGDSYILLGGGGTNWAMGLDRSNSNKLIISAWTSPGNQNALEIDTSQNISIPNGDLDIDSGKLDIELFSRNVGGSVAGAQNTWYNTGFLSDSGGAPRMSGIINAYDGGGGGTTVIAFAWDGTTLTTSTIVSQGTNTLELQISSSHLQIRRTGTGTNAIRFAVTGVQNS